MSMRTAFFAEDEPLARDVLRDAIYRHPSLRLVGEAADGASALAQIGRLRPEVVFMDIQMPEMTGLEVLRRLDYLPRIVFTTAYDQYAVTAFELNAVDYLLKPFTQARFAAAVARLLEGPGHERESLGQVLARAHAVPARLERILVRDRGRIFPLAAADIEYMKSDSKYTVITARGQSFLVRIGISELEAQLDPARFVRIHRSALVNLDFVESMRADDQSQLQIHMRDGTVLGANRDASKVLRDMAI
ncbi:LytR/AlgR family response regulator transcription factor [Massilia sp. LjRoot122]|uniref:LytR/AlgR family response regulator transcription factor n=1 Tax=Massilia sp. LjRoot122 TaxID=3342257 RepID=UPI003ECC3E0A